MKQSNLCKLKTNTNSIVGGEAGQRRRFREEVRAASRSIGMDRADKTDPAGPLKTFAGIY